MHADPVALAVSSLPVSSLQSSSLAVGAFDEATPLTVWIVVLIFVFVECAFIIGLFLPGDSLLLAAGVVLAQDGHEAGALGLAAVATVVAVGGNQVGFLVGRYTGTRILARRDGRVLNRANLDRANGFFERHGFWSIVVARWLPWVRTLAPMIAGAARMDNRRFIVANAIGAICWVPSLLLLGYYGADLLDAQPWLKQASAVIMVAIFVLGTGYGLYRFRSEMRRPVDDDPSTGAATVPEQRTEPGRDAAPEHDAESSRS